MPNSVCRQTVTVELENGLHLVPCSQIAQAARRYACAVTIYKGTQAVDAKNVLDLMTLNADHGTQLDLEASGDGAAEAIEELVRLFESNFEATDDDSV
jgi:phosphocarrier protein HPr